MRYCLYFVYKLLLKVYYVIYLRVTTFISRLYFYINDVDCKSIKVSFGLPFIHKARNSTISIGSHFVMNNKIKGNPIGNFFRCSLVAENNAYLKIGDNVGISQAAIICHKEIVIGNNVKIGGGAAIYDTDFHSLDYRQRMVKSEDLRAKKSIKVVIGDNVFIGAYSLILKGVSIGANSIIGAGSVVTKNIPENQIWAGNPAKYIKNI